MTQFLQERLIATCSSDAEKMLHAEIANMNQASSKAAIQNLILYLRTNTSTSDHDKHMNTTFINFLERSQCPPSENSCLNLHIHTIVYMLNSRQILIGNTSIAPESSMSTCALGSPESPSQTPCEASCEVSCEASCDASCDVSCEADDEFLREMKQLGL